MLGGELSWEGTGAAVGEREERIGHAESRAVLLFERQSRVKRYVNKLCRSERVE
jgi:hypothetical protein